MTGSTLYTYGQPRTSNTPGEDGRGTDVDPETRRESDSSPVSHEGKEEAVDSSTNLGEKTLILVESVGVVQVLTITKHIRENRVIKFRCQKVPTTLSNDRTVRILEFQ